MNTVLRSLYFSCPKRRFQTSTCLNYFWEKDTKGGYDTAIPPLPYKERMKHGWKELKNEISLWSQEVKEHLESDPLLTYRPGEVDVVWQFSGEKSTENWIVTCDKDHNEGFSHCTLTTNKEGKGLFSGEIIQRVPLDGRVTRAGYCNIKTQRTRKSFKRDAYLDWSHYNMLIMKVRGDGRNYMLNIHTRGYFDIHWNDIYHFVLFTRGGPYWQVARIPLSKFFLSSKGRVQDQQMPLPTRHVTEFGITAARYSGNFSLEIDYIGLEFDPSHVEETAYELYEVGQFIARP